MTDEELIDAAKGFREGIMGKRTDPSRMCFMIAAPLEGWLAWMGLKVRLVETQLEWINHVFIELPDGRVLDPTADQFDELKATPIYLGKPHPVIHAK
jgi:hypothetical protein